MPHQRAPTKRLEHRIPRSIEQTLYGADTQYQQAPGIGDIAGLYRQLLQERQGSLANLEQERLGINQISQATPELQNLARNAAYAPLEGMQPYMDQALLQAQGAAAGRGLGRSSISAALQALAVPRIMQPALAQAQGQYSQALLDLPYQERALRMQNLGQGMDLARFGQASGIAIGQNQQGLRESAFEQLQRAQTMAQSQLEYQKANKGSGFGKALAKVGGAALGAGLSAITGGIGGVVGPALGAAGGRVGRGLLGALGGGNSAQSFINAGWDPSWGDPRGMGQGMQMTATQPYQPPR